MALSPRDRRILMIGGGVVAAALALFLIVNLLGGGSDTTTALPPVSVGPAPAPSVSPSPSPSVVQDFSGRDPFSPPAGLATAVAATSGAPAGGGGGGGGGGGTIPGTTTFTSTPPTIPPPTTTSSSPPPTHTPPPPPSCKGEKPTVCKEIGSHVVLLERVFKRHHKPEADVKVDRKIYKSLKEGDRFAHHFKLVGFNEQNCPRIIFGEEGFTLCESGKHHHH